MLSGRTGSDAASDSEVEMLSDDEWNEICLQSGAEGLPLGSTLQNLRNETLVDKSDEGNETLAVEMATGMVSNRTMVQADDTAINCEGRASRSETPDGDATWRIYVHSILNELSGIELADCVTQLRDTIFALVISADERQWHLIVVAEALYRRIDGEIANFATAGLEEDDEVRKQASK